MDSLKERALELIQESFAMDAHFDLALDMDDRRERGDRFVWSARHEKPIKAGGWKCVVSSLFIHSCHLPEMGLRKAMDQISALVSEAEEQPEGIAVCASMAEVDRANATGKVGILMSFEGLDPLGNDPALLKLFYRLGVRAAGVAWSRRNYAADGCFFSPMREGRKGGLTPFGIDVIEEAERLGMVLDISHLNDEGVSDLAAFTKKPFIASHSNCRALVPVKRNLTDEQIKLVASRGGVIGMNGCSAFVSEKEGRGIGPADLALHIDHIVRLVGEDHVGLGLDCCDGLANFYEGPAS
ncbi:MAG: dipeptidase, partial [Synergistaceae bacterium]|nr:dipeptidase [Synergistaceae bacterium]